MSDRFHNRWKCFKVVEASSQPLEDDYEIVADECVFSYVVGWDGKSEKLDFEMVHWSFEGEERQHDFDNPAGRWFSSWGARHFENTKQHLIETEPAFAPYRAYSSEYGRYGDDRHQWASI